MSVYSSVLAGDPVLPVTNLVRIEQFVGIPEPVGDRRLIRGT